MSAGGLRSLPVCRIRREPRAPGPLPAGRRPLRGQPTRDRGRRM